MSAIILRPLERADAEQLIAANRASIDLHRPWVSPFTDEEGFEAHFATLGEQTVSLVAREPAGGAIIGVFTLSQIFRKAFQNAYLGFYAVRDGEGRGLMTQALRLTAVHAFGDLGLHRIEANVQPANLRSIALLQRAGFRKEGYSPRYLKIGGEWRDHERWALLSDEA